jgi:hypothetical protein
LGSFSLPPRSQIINHLRSAPVTMPLMGVMRKP